VYSLSAEKYIRKSFYIQNKSSSCNMSNLHVFLIVKIIIYPQPFKKNFIVILITTVVNLYFLGYNI